MFPGEAVGTARTGSEMEREGAGHPQRLLPSGANCLQRGQRILLMFTYLGKGPPKTETGWMDERVEGGLLLCFFGIKKAFYFR